MAEGARLVLVYRDGKVEGLGVDGPQLLRVTRDGQVETLVAGGWGDGRFTNSMAVGPDGRVWIGMRQFVGVFDPKDPGSGVRLRVPSKEFLRPKKGS